MFSFLWLIKFPYFLWHWRKHTDQSIPHTKMCWPFHSVSVCVCVCDVSFGSHICDSVASLTLLFLVLVCLFVRRCCCCSVFFLLFHFIVFYFILFLFFLPFLNYIIKRWFKLIHTHQTRYNTYLCVYTVKPIIRYWEWIEMSMSKERRRERAIERPLQKKRKEKKFRQNMWERKPNLKGDRDQELKKASNRL